MASKRDYFWLFLLWPSLEYRLDVNIMHVDPNYTSCVLATLTENIQDHRAAWKTRLFYSFSLKLHYSGFSAACNLLQTLNLSRPVGRTDFLPEFYLSKKAQYSVHHSMSVRVKGKELLLLKSLTG